MPAGCSATRSIIIPQLFHYHPHSLPNFAVSMMDNFIVLILVGLVIGTFGTLIGAGGGFLLVPLLLLAKPDLAPNTVTAISIAIVALNAISGSIAYAKSRRIDYKSGIIFALYTIPGSIGGVLLVKYIPKNLFDIIFGILLIGLATYLFIKSGKQTIPATEAQKNSKNLKHHTITDSSGMVHSYHFNQRYGIIISILVGFLSPLLGIGGGIIHVPAMVHVLQFPVYIATATSHFILAIMSTVSVITHIIRGSYTHEATRMVIGLAIGVIPGAQLGAYLSHKIKTHLIIRILAICLSLVGIRLLLHF